MQAGIGSHRKRRLKSADPRFGSDRKKRFGQIDMANRYGSDRIKNGITYFWKNIYDSTNVIKMAFNGDFYGYKSTLSVHLPIIKSSLFQQSRLLR